MGAVFSGIECPKCGSIDLKVLETRRQKKAIARRRECDRGHTFSTVELVADDDGLPSTTPVVPASSTDRCDECPILRDVKCRLACSVRPLGTVGGKPQ